MNDINVFFEMTEQLKLKSIPRKTNMKILVFEKIADIFQFKKFYKEYEVNKLLKTVYSDFPSLRRYLVDFKLLCRDSKGYIYWRNENYKKDIHIENKNLYSFIIRKFKNCSYIEYSSDQCNLLIDEYFNASINQQIIILEKNGLRLNKEIFRLSHFNLYLELSKEITLIKNTKNENVIKIKMEKAELNNISDMSDSVFFHMLDLGFVVLKNEDEFDDYIKQSLSWYKENKVASIMFVPTTRCNFYCRYCYENDINRNEDMTICELIENFNKLKQFSIEEQLKAINFTLYGGEPSLISKELADEFIKQIISLSIPYSIDIVSNGYELSESLKTVMRNLKIGSYQITLDGPKRIHDSIRKLSIGGNTFDNIIKNMHAIFDGNLCNEIIVRINCSQLNLDFIPELLDFLELEFNSVIDKMFVSFGLLSSGMSDKGNEEVENTRLGNKEIIKYCNLYKLAQKKGFRCASRYCVSNLCMNKEPGNIIIAPNFKYYKCMKAFGYKELTCDFESIYDSNLNLNSIVECKEKKCEFLPYCFLGCLMEDYITNGTMNKFCEYDQLKTINEGILYELYK